MASETVEEARENERRPDGREVERKRTERLAGFRKKAPDLEDEVTEPEIDGSKISPEDDGRKVEGRRTL